MVPRVSCLRVCPGSPGSGRRGLTVAAIAISQFHLSHAGRGTQTSTQSRIASLGAGGPSFRFARAASPDYGAWSHVSVENPKRGKRGSPHPDRRFVFSPAAGFAGLHLGDRRRAPASFALTAGHCGVLVRDSFQGHRNVHGPRGSAFREPGGPASASESPASRPRGAVPRWSLAVFSPHCFAGLPWVALLVAAGRGPPAYGPIGARRRRGRNPNPRVWVVSTALTLGGGKH